MRSVTRANTQSPRLAMTISLKQPNPEILIKILYLCGVFTPKPLR
jgi:hypothetical protein